MTTFKVAFVGDAGVGKTSLIKAFIGEEIKNLTSTVGIDFYSFTKDNYNIVIWDFAGQIWFREVVIDFLKGAALIVMVFDLSRPRTLMSLVEFWANQVKQISGRDTLVIVVGNKKDLKKIDDGTIERVIDDLKQRINVKLYIQTSALYKENISALFNNIFDLVKVTQFLANKREKSE